jgi:hypothetical protein
MLGGGMENQNFNSLVASRVNASHISLNAPEMYDTTSRRGSVSSTMGFGGTTTMMSVPGNKMGRRGSTLPFSGDVPLGHLSGRLNPTAMKPGERRASAFGAGAFNVGKVVPTSQQEQNISVNLLINDEETGEQDGFRALPKWWTDYVSNRITAALSLLILFALTMVVFVYDVTHPE